MLTEEQKTGIRDLAQQDHAAGEPLWSGESGLVRWARAAGEAGDSTTSHFLSGVCESRRDQLQAEVVYRSARIALLPASERKLYHLGAFDWHRAGPHGDSHTVVHKEATCSP